MSKLIDSGAIAADYYMVAILEQRRRTRSTRRAPVTPAYCVADEIDGRVPAIPHRAVHHGDSADRRPGTTFPDNAKLIEIAREAGVAGKVPDCIKGR